MSNRRERTIHLSAEQLLDELAKRDEVESVEGVSPNVEADSTLKVLKTELDTLAAQIREPAPVVPFEDESDCRRVTELVEALGWDRHFPRRLRAISTSRKCQVSWGNNSCSPSVYKALHTRLDKIVALKVLPE